jgi:hypothetical protein
MKKQIPISGYNILEFDLKFKESYFFTRGRKNCKICYLESMSYETGLSWSFLRLHEDYHDDRIVTVSDLTMEKPTKKGHVTSARISLF